MLPSLQVPYTLLALFFLHAFFQTFPMTAYGKWLFQVIHMAPATTSIYYSITFFPWNIKPLYGLISDHLPLFGYHRKPYIVICEIGAALSLVVTGALVSTVTGAFVVRMVDAICEAFAQIMLGILLVDLASGDVTSKSSAKVQSWSNATKNAGSIAALLIGIPLYANPDFDPRAIISWNSVFPMAAALLCVLGLGETRKINTKDPCKSSSSLSAAGSDDPAGAHSCTSRLCVFCTKVGDFGAEFKRDCMEKLGILLPVLPCMMFFFLCSALPNDGVVWYQYTYHLLPDQLQCVQYTSVVGMVARFLSCLVYGKWCSGRNVRQVFMVSTLTCMLAGLPKLLLAPPRMRLPVSVCVFSNVESFVTSFTGEFALLQLLVVATFYCPQEKRVHGLTYALYLSCMDFGGVVSGLLTSLLTYLLGIVVDPATQQVNWDSLWLLVVLSAGGQVLILLFLWVLPEKVDFQDLLPEQERLLQGETDNERVPSLHCDRIHVSL